MTGWRVGWAIGPKDMIKAATNLQSHATSNVANVSQRAAIAAVSGDLAAVEEMKQAFDRRRKTIVSMLNEIDGVVCPEPKGAFYVYPSVKGLLGREVDGVTPGDVGRAGRAGPGQGRGGRCARVRRSGRRATCGSPTRSATTTWSRASPGSRSSSPERWSAVGTSGRLPKAHLHLHFTGSMRHATLIELAARDGIHLPDALVEDWPPVLSAADEKGWFRFQRLYDVARSVLRTEADVRRLVLEAAEDDVADGGVWLEIQVDPSGYAARFGGITAFTDLVLDAVGRCRRPNRAGHRGRDRGQPHPAPSRRAHPGPAGRAVRRPRRGRFRPLQRRAARPHR